MCVLAESICPACILLVGEEVNEVILAPPGTVGAAMHYVEVLAEAACIHGAGSAMQCGCCSLISVPPRP